MDLYIGDRKVDSGFAEDPQQARSGLASEAFRSPQKGAFNPHDVAQAGAKAIVDIVERNGGFGESDPYGVPKDRDITKILLSDARKGGYLDEMVRDMNMMEIKE